ncbi:hypothetical protein BH10BDE1_BH10BDE1_11170 [soil metagenome]
MNHLARMTLLTLQLVTPVLLLSASVSTAQPISASGPKIPRVVALRPQPVFERIAHPAPAAGRKLVTFEVPAAMKLAFENDQLHVSVFFSVMRETDDCNETKLYGRVLENEVPDFPSLRYFALEIKPNRISKTMKECEEISRAVRKVEVATDLRALRPFRDTQVFDVPENVEVSVTVFSPAGTGLAQQAH